MPNLGIDTVKALLPKGARTLVTDELMDKLNRMGSDPLLLDSMKENFISYISVLSSGKYKMDDYLHAVKFVSHKLLGDSDIDAYTKTFPERYQRLVDEGVARSDMGAYVSAYRKNKLVVQIIEQTLVPDHIFNAPLRQQMLNEAANIALNGRSEVARVQAINTILANTKAPETIKMELDIGMKENDAIAELREVTQKLARQQRLAIESGVSTPKEIAHSRIIDVNIEES